MDTAGDLSAIFILGDSMDWGLDMQVMTDALLHNEALGEEHIPIYACNADIVYTGRHPKPRYTQGLNHSSLKSCLYCLNIILFISLIRCICACI